MRRLIRIFAALILYSLQIMPRIEQYIHEKADWPDFYWDSSRLITPLGEVRNLQGKLLGKMESLGFELRNDALLKTLTLDVLKSTEIEGEFLNSNQVRSSIARKLGMEISGSVPSDRDVDGVVEMMVDATQNCFNSLSKERLFDWHAALFPTGRSGMVSITVADYRKDLKVPMQVVSGAMGKENIHFEAPDSTRVEKEMQVFLKWFNSTQNIDLVIKAATAHLWFVTIHPFDDGNGRIARSLADLLLARSDNTTQRFYSMSAQIRKERKKYYEMLELSQKGELDITTWIVWFLNCLINALKSTESVLNDVLIKAQFWSRNAKTILNERQKKMMNKLLDGFDGKLTTSKWAKIAKCSKDTALRDIQDLIEKQVLQKEPAGGRSTNYELVAV